MRMRVEGTEEEAEEEPAALISTPSSRRPTSISSSNHSNQAILSSVGGLRPSTRIDDHQDALLPSSSSASSAARPIQHPSIPARNRFIGRSSSTKSIVTHLSTSDLINHRLRSYSIQNPSFHLSPHHPSSRPPTGSNLNLSPRSFDPFQPSPLQFDLNQTAPTNLSPRKLSTPSYSSAQPSSIYHQPPSPRRASLQLVGSSAPPHRTIFHPRPPRSFLLAWSYCQFEGYFELQDKHIDLIHFQSLRHPQTRGGGQLVPDDPDDLHRSNPRPTWMAWLFGSSPPIDRPSNHHPHPPSSSSFSSHSNPPNRFPVFQNPISLLDVDVRLQPGQSRVYSFSMDLPINLPPTHRGKFIKFNYELIVGTNVFSDSPPPIDQHQTKPSNQALSADPLRTSFSTSSSGHRHREHKSRVFRIPIRIFNHVYLNDSKPFYDLLKPIISSRDTAKARRIFSQSTADQLTPKAQKPNSTLDGSSTSYAEGLARLEKYGYELLGGSIIRQVRGGGPMMKEPNDPIEELQDGCMTAVELISRSAPKVSFDINKDGRLVAQLSIVKSIYRLGETIEGTIEMNGSNPKMEAGKVIKSGISLESIEELDPRIMKESNHHANEDRRRIRSKIYSEQEELVIDTARSKFCLVIPSDGSPDFETNFVKLGWRLKLRLQFIPNPDPPSPDHERPPIIPPTPTGHHHHHPSNSHGSYRYTHQLKKNSQYYHHHQRVGSSITDGSHQINRLADRLSNSGHSRSKSIPKELISSNPSRLTTGSQGVYCHLISHSAPDGIFKPIPEFGLIPLELDVNPSPDYHYNPSSSFSPAIQAEQNLAIPTTTGLGATDHDPGAHSKDFELKFSAYDGAGSLPMNRMNSDGPLFDHHRLESHRNFEGRYGSSYPSLQRSSSISSPSTISRIRGGRERWLGYVGGRQKEVEEEVVARRSKKSILVPTRIEFLECFIPIQVLPGNTPFKPSDHTFII